jgi:hypothetical protein
MIWITLDCSGDGEEHVITVTLLVHRSTVPTGLTGSNGGIALPTSDERAENHLPPKVAQPLFDRLNIESNHSCYASEFVDVRIDVNVGCEMWCGRMCEERVCVGAAFIRRSRCGPTAAASVTKFLLKSKAMPSSHVAIQFRSNFGYFPPRDHNQGIII